MLSKMTFSLVLVFAVGSYLACYVRRCSDAMRSIDLGERTDAIKGKFVVISQSTA